jgi:lambda repressor-like predicted transcriptional regulator
MVRRRWGERTVEYLFSDHDLHVVLEAQRERMVQAINEADASKMTNRSTDEVKNEFVDRFQVRPPEVTEGAVSVEVDEAQVDVSADHSRHVFDRSKPFRIPGIRATYYVPFTGERELLKCRPSTYTTVPPAVDAVREKELVLVYERPDTNVAGTKQGFEGDLATLKKYIGWVERDTVAFNETLPQLARERVAARQARVREMPQGAESLGVPIRRANSGTSPAPLPAPRRKPQAQPQRQQALAGTTYDVALSFAGEDREYVEQVATGLKDAGVSVFYDMFERADLGGKNLVDHLARVYPKRSRYVAMFISKHYVEKAWTTHERQHAQARALVAKEEYILPARFDDTEVPGMTATVGHIDLRRTSPAELVALIRAKLGK